jgi:predicted GTPase
MEEIADILRRQEKPVFYVVNKVDGPKHEDKVLNFDKVSRFIRFRGAKIW